MKELLNNWGLLVEYLEIFKCNIKRAREHNSNRNKLKLKERNLKKKQKMILSYNLRKNKRRNKRNNYKVWLKLNKDLKGQFHGNFMLDFLQVQVLSLLLLWLFLFSLHKWLELQVIGGLGNGATMFFKFLKANIFGFMQ